MAEQTMQRSAQDVFRAAYENRYTWDDNFPGYEADLEIKQGDEVHTGQVRIAKDMTVEVSGFEDEKVQESAYTQMRDIVTHRKRNTFEKAHGKNSFAFGETDANGAVEILVTGDAMGSNYKVKGQEIAQVSRVMGRMAFTIDHKTSLDTGSGYVSSRYDAIFRNPETQAVMREMEFEDTYEPFGDYYLMTRQVIRATAQGEITTTEFNFSNIHLL
ncbi:MAG: DUF3386 domain-containing protein [Thainema sp.]